MPPALIASDHSVLTRFLLPSLPASETNIERSLLWALLVIQGITTWTLVETGSLSIIVSARVYQSLPEHPLPEPQVRNSTSFPAIM